MMEMSSVQSQPPVVDSKVAVLPPEDHQSRAFGVWMYVTMSPEEQGSHYEVVPRECVNTNF